MVKRYHLEPYLPRRAFSERVDLIEAGVCVLTAATAVCFHRMQFHHRRPRAWRCLDRQLKDTESEVIRAIWCAGSALHHNPW